MADQKRRDQDMERKRQKMREYYQANREQLLARANARYRLLKQAKERNNG
jgi:hypothetical protein